MTEIEPLDLLPLQPVVTRLEETLKPTFKSIGTAADALAATAKGATIAGPSATVIYMGAIPYEVREGSGPLTQGFEVTIGVVLGLTLAGAKGAAGLKAMERPAGMIRAALFGWFHPAADLKFRSAGESVEDFEPTTGVLYYRLDFFTRVRIQES